MSLLLPCYATREDVKSALDYKETARNNGQIDRAIDAASRVIEGDLNRILYPQQGTRFFDWPNQQRALAWRLWLDENDLISVDTLISGGVTIPPSGFFLEPVNSGPPFRSIEINISSQSAFSTGSTWQRSIAATGLWGFSNTEAPAGTVTASASSSATAVAVSNSAAVGVGQLLRVGTERLLVTEKQSQSTGLVQQNALSALMSDNQIHLTSGAGATFAIGEVTTLDGERMRIVDIPGDTLTVIRAWDGSTLAAHTGATLFCPRLCTVARGILGTTSAAISQNAPVAAWQSPGPVRDLTIAYASNTALMESAGYARTVGTAMGNSSSQRGSSSVLGNIAALAAEVNRTCGRQARVGAI